MTMQMTELRIWLTAWLFVAGSFSIGRAASNDSLIDAAKREGELVYYASMNLSEANAIIAEFEKRYPFIKVKMQRTGSEKLLTRVLTEFRAKKTFADVIQTVEFSMHIFHRSGALARYPPQSNAKLFLEFALSREGQKLMQTPGRHSARADFANEQAAMLKELKIVQVNPALAEKLDEYAKQLRTIFGG